MSLNNLKLESEVQAKVRLAYSRKGGVKLFRNNSGAFKDTTGRIVRYGLGNESARFNDKVKSHDLIGWQSVVITPDMVGKTFAVFLSVECKREGWVPNPSDERENAQRKWSEEVTKAGGIARFVSDASDV